MALEAGFELNKLRPAALPMVDNGGPKAGIWRVGWSLRSGGWPLSFWQYDKPKAFCFPQPVAPEFALDNPPVFLIRFAQKEHSAGYRTGPERPGQ